MLDMEIIFLIGVAWLLYAWLKTDSSTDQGRRDTGASDTSTSTITERNRKTTNSGSRTEHEPNAILIQRAIDLKKILEFTYVDMNGEITHRAVTPNYLERRHESNVLCLIAHCHLRGASRTFVVRRMQNVSMQ